MKEMPPISNTFIKHFFLLVFYYNALESLSNCIDNSAIISDFRSAVSSSLIFVTNLLTFPFIIPSNSVTLLLNASTFVLALNNLTRSSILPLNFYFYLGKLQVFSISTALFKKLDATEIEEAYFETSSI